MKTIIVYGSTTGTTENVGGIIAKGFENSKLVDVDNLDFNTLADYDLIILGTSTWGIGDLQDDWESNLYKLSDIDLSGKHVALFGTGDQEGYSDSYIDGVHTIYQEIVKSKPTLIGKTSTDGYIFDSSLAVVEGELIGLAIDEDSQPHLSDKRITSWISQLKEEIK